MATATAMRWVRRLALPRRRAANPAPPLPAAGLGWPCCNFKHSRATGTLAADCSSAARPVHDVAGGGGGNAEAVAGRHIISVSLRGRPTRLQASAIERLWPRYGVGPRPSLTAMPRDRRRRRGSGEPARGVDSGGDSGDQQDVLITWPRDNAARVLEIGTGMGEGFVKLAAAWPHVDFVGVELYEPGVGALLLGAEQAQLRNARVVCRDAREVLVRQVEAGSLDAVHVLFPDPWPKKRHHKRRLLQPAFVELVASKLRVGGVLHVATDWEELAHEHHDVLEACPLLRNTAAPARVNGDATGDAGVPASAAAGTAPETTTADNTDGFVARPQWRPVTKFEARARQEGRNTWDMCYRRVQPPGGGGGSGGGDGCDGAEEPRALPVGPPPPPPPR